MKRAIRRTFALLLLALPTYAVASLTRVPTISEQLGQGATVIEADITKLENSTVTLDGEVIPVRLMSLENVDSGSGATEPDSRLLLPGGTLGDYDLDMEDVPELAVGEHVVLVVVAADATSPHGTLRLSSFGNGVFHREADARYGDTVTERTGRQLVDFGCTYAPTVFRADDGDTPVPWSVFLTAIRTCTSTGNK